MRQQDICDEFVREHAVPAEDAESWSHLGLDGAYHPTRGYWFPADEFWPEASGVVRSKYEVPLGDMVQYPCSDREPEIRGRDDLPDWVVNRTLGGARGGD